MQIKPKKRIREGRDKQFFGSLLVSKIWVVERQCQPLVNKTPDFVGCDLRHEQRRKNMARIRHLAILTEDVEKLVKFYTSAFGLKIVNGIGTATYLSDGHINLAIIPIAPERKIEGPQLKPGLYHFGFEVDDVAGLREACKELNATTGIDKRPPNREAEYRVHDPDGNPIDLSQHGWPI
jgi:catechol 2,3-dioxygenase-like lactoylglutathione lyase family enzyme